MSLHDNNLKKLTVWKVLYHEVTFSCLSRVRKSDGRNFGWSVRNLSPYSHKSEIGNPICYRRLTNLLKNLFNHTKTRLGQPLNVWYWKTLGWTVQSYCYSVRRNFRTFCGFFKNFWCGYGKQSSEGSVLPKPRVDDIPTNQSTHIKHHIKVS